VIIDCVADLHGSYPALDGGDLLIVAGDLTARDSPDEYHWFIDWIVAADYKRKIVIAGNHDGTIRKDDEFFHIHRIDQYKDFDYLQDSGTEFDGLKIWGSPWTPEFCGWDFMLPRGPEIAKKWALIPDDTDILVTHGPPWGVLDKNSDGEHCGCEELRLALERVKPKLHVFGHIHEGYGQMLFKHQGPNTICVNASHMDALYNPVNKVIRVML
jgi:Icc-related predicted phosphoesterase